MRNEVVLKIWLGLCKNALFLWQTIVNLRMGVCLQNYLGCYLSSTTKLYTNLKLRHRPIIPIVAYAYYQICIFINIYENIKNVVNEWG